jgi:hypothetical protein
MSGGPEGEAHPARAGFKTGLQFDCTCTTLAHLEGLPPGPLPVWQTVLVGRLRPPVVQVYVCSSNRGGKGTEQWQSIKVKPRHSPGHKRIRRCTASG